MNVKRYIGETAQEAMQKVRVDLGKDAIILNTRKIRRKGLLGFFTKPLVEVVATIDTDFSRASAPSKSPSAPTAQNFTRSFEEQETKQHDFKKELYKNISIISSDDQKADIHKEVDEIKSLLNKVYNAVKEDSEENAIPDIVKQFLCQLEDNEVDKEIIDEIKSKVTGKLGYNEQTDEQMVRECLSEILSTYIKEDVQKYSNSPKRRVIVFIGPTGVGKTTTLAKLAANYALHDKKRVALITCDTYRIAAVEQLKTYSEIIGVPLSVVYTPGEIATALDNYKDMDVILIDTAGRNHKDKYRLMELKSLIKSDIEYEVFLVVSATTKYSDCIDIIKSYNFIKNFKLIFTKLDETSSLGIVINIAKFTQKPISYFTTGQSVPDDIEVADKHKVINQILGEKSYERSSRKIERNN